MKTKSEQKASKFYMAWLILLCYSSGGGTGCGTDVGNAGKPRSAAAEIAALVEVQFDESLDAAIESIDQEDFALLSLTGGETSQLVDLSCLEHPEDGSLSSIKGESRERELERGRAAKRRKISDVVETRSEVRIFPKAGGDALACNEKGRPILKLSQLNGLQTEGSFTKNRQRKVLLESDGSLIKESKLSSSSQRSSRSEVISISSQTLVWQRESKFSSSLRIESSEQAAPLERTVETIQAIVLEKTRTRSQGITQARILRGAVQSMQDGQKKLILRYEDLVLGIGEECLPTSGQIKGEVYASKEATSPETTFTLEFSAEGAIVRSEDGSEEELELETCKI